MSSLFSVLAPPPPLVREVGLMGSVAPVASVETAQAPPPPDPARAGARPRDLRRDDRPVGPPPAFDVNVLQDLRQRLSEGPDVKPATPDDLPAEPPHLDKKV